MKKREPKVDPTNNIILNDKELEVLIRQLVKKAHQKGARMSWLNKAISTIWKEEFPVEKEEYKLTAEGLLLKAVNLSLERTSLTSIIKSYVLCMLSLKKKIELA